MATRPGLDKTGLDFAAGRFSGQGEEAFVGSIGPRVSFRTSEETFSLDIGIAPTYISRDEFGNEDFGGHSNSPALQVFTFIFGDDTD